ncbi:MAG: dehydrogenase [Pseudomonadota bacterium]|nr:dehydrogenase [Pseudomonadota bacterium]
MRTTLRFIGADEIRSLLTFPMLIAALEAAHRRPKIEIQNGLLGSEHGHYFVRHAVDGGRYMASKLITSFPANLDGGAMPAVQSLCVMFDGRNGQPLAILDGTEITYWRTAADSALGAKILAPLEPTTLLLVGAGEMSARLIRAHRTVRPSLRRVLVWNRSKGRAAQLVARLLEEGIESECIEDLAAATRMADVISTCTRSHQPLILGANLRPGVHLDLVGGYTPATREADDEAARRSLVFVDRRESAFDGVGDILQPIARGAIRASDVRGDLYDLVGGCVAGRTAHSDITFFKNAGGAHLDLMTAELIVRALGGYNDLPE